jgi:hypothetical protein
MKQQWLKAYVFETEQPGMGLYSLPASSEVNKKKNGLLGTEFKLCVVLQYDFEDNIKYII